MKGSIFKIFLIFFVFIVIFEKWNWFLILNFFTTIYLLESILKREDSWLELLFFPLGSAFLTTSISSLDFYKSFFLFFVPVAFIIITRIYFIRKATVPIKLVLSFAYIAIFKIVLSIYGY